MLKQMSDLKVRDGKNGGVKENVVQNAISSNGNNKTSEGWVTVQKKEKPEKQRFARKGRHGLAWRVPHDSTRGKKHLVKKQEKKKKLTDSKDPQVNQGRNNVDFGKDAAVDEQEALPNEKHPINTNGTKVPSKSSWAAAVLRGTKTKKGSRLDNSEKARREKKYPGHSGAKKSASSSSTPKRAARMAIPTSKRPNESSAQQHQSLRRSSSNSEKLRLRKQLQSILFQNVNQAVDELYYICEFDSDIDSATAALELMTGWRDSFQTLVDTVKLQKEYEVLVNDIGDSNNASIEDSSGGLEKSGSALKKKGSVAWEIKKSSPSTLSGINQIVDSVLKRANKASSQQSQKIIASLEPYDGPNKTASTCTSTSRRSVGIDISENSNEDGNGSENDGQIQKKQEVITSLSGVYDDDQTLSQSRSPGTLEKSQNAQDIQEDNKFKTNKKSNSNNATTQVLEMLRLDNTTALWGDMMMSEDESDEADDSDDDDEESGAQQCPPSPARSSPPEKQRSLHAKLSSPERAKPTPMEAQRKFIEKQSLARINRERIESERKAWLNLRETRLRSTKEQREKMHAEKVSNIQTRLKAASDRRDERMANIRKRAESENDKISEIVFIKNLTQENKAKEIQRRLDEGSERARKYKEEIVNSKKTRHASIVEAADEVRAKLRKEVQERKALLQRRLEQAEMQRQRIVKAKEEEKKKKETMAKERLELLNKKAEVEREKRRLQQEKKEAKALEIRNAKEKAKLDKKIRQEEAANARRKTMEEEALAELNAKKMEMKLREDRAQLNHRRSIEAKKASANLRKPLQISSRHADDRSGEFHHKSPKRNSPKRKGSNTSPTRKSSYDDKQRIKAGGNLQHNDKANTVNRKGNAKVSKPSTSQGDAAAHATDNVTSKEAKLAKKNAMKAKKRQMKRCKQKIAAFWQENEDKLDFKTETADSDSGSSEENKALHRQFADFADFNGGFEEQGSKLRAVLHNSKGKAFENETASYFRTSKAFIRILSLCTRETTDRVPHVVTSALRTVELAIVKNFENRLYFHANGAMEQISSILSFALTDAIEKVDPDATRGKLEWNNQLLISCLRVLAISLNMSEAKWIPYDYHENVAILFTIAHHVEKLGELYRLYELQLGSSGSIRKTQTMDVMLNGLLFLSSFTSSLIEDDAQLDGCHKLPKNVSDSFGSTCISGLLSLLFSMADSKESWETEIVLNALDVMIVVARLDISMFQELLSSPSLQPQFYHVLNALLDKSSMSDINDGIKVDAKDKVIKKSLILMGFHALNCQKNQESLNWGTQPTALQRICSLPFRFFSEEENKHVLFPTLISVCYENNRNTSVVELELSVDMIVDYIEKMIKEMEVVATTGTSTNSACVDKNENDPKIKLDANDIDEEDVVDSEAAAFDMIRDKKSQPLHWAFEHRFPRSSWEDALKFFSSI